MNERDTSRGSTGVQPSAWLSRSVDEARRLDLAVYSAIAGTPTPSLDRALRRLSSAANYSRLSIASAVILGVTGGRRGREAAVMGLASVAVTATALNLGVKSIVHRRRPDRAAERVPLPRQVRMPSSPAFPSGHSGAAFAFATGVGYVLPAAGFPLRALGALVAYSRVHTGVHYPSDVLAGALLGEALAQVTTHVLAQQREWLEALPVLPSVTRPTTSRSDPDVTRTG
jgi:membrane-associated phospholipid phosphatase